MNRRGFLGAILAAGVAPAFIGSSILMPVRKLWTPPERNIAMVGAYMISWTISNEGSAEVKVEGVRWGEMYQPAELVVAPGESVTYDNRLGTLSRTWKQRVNI